MRFFLLMLLILMFGCNKSEPYIRNGSKSDYLFYLNTGAHCESIDEGDNMVVITVYKTAVHSIDGISRNKGIISKFRIDKTIKSECEKEWREQLKKNTIALPFNQN